MLGPLEFEEVVQAYLDCRRHKRLSHYATAFEFELERNLFELFEDLVSGTYQIGHSVAFVVEQPKIREIWASSFRDRVVHHLIYNRLAPVFTPRFIRNSFACISGRGVLDGSNRLAAGLRSITSNWQVQAYYLKADVRNFFNSIDKKILFTTLEPDLKDTWLRDLTHQVIFHDPRKNSVLKSKTDAFTRVPKSKSLLKGDPAKGLPIGNLTSQFFANVYLDQLDQFVKHKVRVEHYYRYVDDFVILNTSPSQLNRDFQAIQDFLQENLALEVHPFKKRVAPVSQGLDFIGFQHKPYHRQLRQRTANKMKSLALQWQRSKRRYDQKSLLTIRNRLNSYFGLAKWAATHRLRISIAAKMSCLFIYPDDRFLKLIVPK